VTVRGRRRSATVDGTATRNDSGAGLAALGTGRRRRRTDSRGTSPVRIADDPQERFTGLGRTEVPRSRSRGSAVRLLWEAHLH